MLWPLACDQVLLHPLHSGACLAQSSPSQQACMQGTPAPSLCFVCHPNPLANMPRGIDVCLCVVLRCAPRDGAAWLGSCTGAGQVRGSLPRCTLAEHQGAPFGRTALLWAQCASAGACCPRMLTLLFADRRTGRLSPPNCWDQAPGCCACFVEEGMLMCRTHGVWFPAHLGCMPSTYKRALSADTRTRHTASWGRGLVLLRASARQQADSVLGWGRRAVGLFCFPLLAVKLGRLACVVCLGFIARSIQGAAASLCWLYIPMWCLLLSSSFGR